MQPRLVWSIETGDGYASPVVADGRVVYVHRMEREIVVECFELTGGRLYWRHVHPATFRGRYGGGDGPRGSAVIDSGRVFVHSVEGRLFCFELSTGRVLWQRDLMREFGLVENFFGVVSSPLVHGGRLFVNLGAPQGPTVAAFDVATGRLVDGCGVRWGASCASPVLGRSSTDGEPALFVLAGGRSRPPTGGLLVCSLSPLRVRARHPFRSRMFASVTATSPRVAPDGSWVFLSADYGVGSEMLGWGVPASDQNASEEPEARSLVTLWTNDRVTLDFSNPVAIDDVLWVFEERGRGSTALLGLEPRTGAERYRLSLDWEETVSLRDGEEPRVLQGTVGRGSMLGLVGGDRREILCGAESGHLLRIALPRDGGTERSGSGEGGSADGGSPESGRDEPEIVSRVLPFRAPETWTPPVVSNGLLLLCQNARSSYGEATPPRLLCFDLRGGS
jgi:outer membrane protein assembly factor BamB